MRFNLKIEVLLSLFFFGIAAIAIFSNCKLEKSTVQSYTTQDIRLHIPQPKESAAIQRMFYYPFEWKLFYE